MSDWRKFHDPHLGDFEYRFKGPSGRAWVVVRCRCWKGVSPRPAKAGGRGFHPESRKSSLSEAIDWAQGHISHHGQFETPMNHLPVVGKTAQDRCAFCGRISGQQHAGSCPVRQQHLAQLEQEGI